MVLASCSKMGQVHYCLSKLRYGYPVKHPLSEQFGMTLLQPLRLLREIRMFSLFWWPGKAVESYDSLRIYWARRQQISNYFFKTTCCLMLVQNHSELLAKDHCFSSRQATMLHACMFDTTLKASVAQWSWNPLPGLLYTGRTKNTFELCIDGAKIAYDTCST